MDVDRGSCIIPERDGILAVWRYRLRGLDSSSIEIRVPDTLAKGRRRSAYGMFRTIHFNFHVIAGHFRS